MRKQIAVRHYNDLATSSQRTYGYWFTDYQNAVRDAGLPLFAPGDDFLEAYLEKEAKNSVDRALSRMRAIGYRFAVEGLPDPTVHLPIRKQIYEIKTAARHDRLDLLGLVPARARKYATYYVDGQYAPSTQASFEERAQAWKLWAGRNGIDSDHPLPLELVRYMKRFDETSFWNQRNILRALQYYFKVRMVPDVTLSDEVELFLEGARRKGSTGCVPLFVGDVRRIVESLGNDRLDKRDQLAVLLTFFGGLMPTSLSRLQIEGMCLTGDGGLEIHVDGREIYIACYGEEPDLDVVGAYFTYIESVEWRTGALFRSKGLRGEYLPQMSPGALSTAIANATRRAGIAVKCAARSLVKGITIQLAFCFGTVVAAHYLGYTDPESLGRHCPAARAEIEQMHRGRPKRTHRRRRHVVTA